MQLGCVSVLLNSLYAVDAMNASAENVLAHCIFIHIL